MEYAFDSKNNLSAQKEIINGVSRVTGYTYDEDNRLDALTMEGHTVDYTYDALGRVVTQEVKNGEETVLTTTYTYYDPSDTTTSTQIKVIQQTAGDYSLTLSYTYDDNGNILTISDGTNILRYQYGEGNKLTREDDPVAGISTSYLYGENGNPFAELRRPYGDGAAGTQTAYVEYGWDPIWGDMLTSYGERSFTYDPIGNMTGDGKYTYTWEHGRELATMTDSTGTWAFTYDANGMRTKKVKTNTSGTVTDTYTYVYNGSQLSQMTKNGQVLNFFYDGEGRPAYFTYNNTTYYYVTNLQGDVVAILDSTGTMVVNYHYDAYGVLLQTDGAMATTLGTLNPLTYRGYVYDHETGLYYLQSRYYNPAIRQFISADSLLSQGSILGNNMFAYCLNNPVNMADYGGNKPGDLFDTMDEAAIDFAEYINGKSISVDREYGSYIYEQTIFELQAITVYKPTLLDNTIFSFFIDQIFGGSMTKTIFKLVKVTKYSYVEPKRGTAHSVSIPINWFGAKKKVAEIHTHGAYSQGYSNDNFSSTDLNKWINYLATPLGTVRKYNPADGSDIIIYYDAPYDPNHPGRK